MVGRFESGLMGAKLKVLLLSAPLLICIGALVFEFKMRAMHSALAAELLAQTDNISSAGTQLQRIVPDFAAQLPRDERLGQLLNLLKDACGTNNVVLEAVTTWRSPMTATALWRTGIVVEASGGYGQLKAVIAGALDHFPNMTVKSLSFRRSNQSTDVQARIEFVVLTRSAALLSASPQSSAPS